MAKRYGLYDAHLNYINQAVIVDIDGTLAHGTGRDPYDYTRVHEDLPDEQIKELTKMLHEEYWIIIVSGREDYSQEDTEQWLENHDIPYDAIHMRRTKDFRPDTEVKQEIYQELIEPHYNVWLVLDDRNSVVNMWRDIGLKCLQVQAGDY
jgi:ADP-heptose:LPS heptosyltransferase